MKNNQTSLTPDKMRGFVEASNGFTGDYVPKKARELILEAADEIETLKREAEFICRKCGLRQDNPNQKKASF